MKTRSKPPPKSEKADSESTSGSSTVKAQLSPEAANPPQLFILPDELSDEARIIQLEHPRHGTNSTYVICPERGFYEFTKVSAPQTTPRSWLLSSKGAPKSMDEDTVSGPIVGKGDELPVEGFVLRNANLLVATPIDSLFFALPALAPPIPASKASNPPQKLFLSSEDYFERIAAASPQTSGFLDVESIRASIERRIASVCDTVDAGDETMYRISEAKLLAELLKKATRMVENGLTGSMEERFVRKPLEVPTLVISPEDISTTQEDTTSVASGLTTPLVDTPDTQTTDASTECASASFSTASTAATSISGDSPDTGLIKSQAIPPVINAPDGVADLLRLRTALYFLCSRYIPPHLSETIKTLLSSSASSTDFGPLDAHLAHLAKQRQDALAARSLGDVSLKRSMLEDDEDGESRAEKKRKIEEEEKRKKAGESRGVKNLKKVNTSGMKKMSDFFGKK